MECSPTTRLMFIGMWNFADDSGRMPCSPKTIKAQVFPSDNLTSENILGMLKELSANGLIIVYAVEDKEYLQITGWHHQRIDKPQKPKCPAPFFDDSTNIPGTFPPDRKGEEGKGKDNADATRRPLELVSDPADAEKDYFRRSVEVFGKNGRALAAKLLQAKNRNVPLARAALEQASTKAKPIEYIGAIIRSRDGPEDLRSRGEAW